jgi:SIT4-associating protein SAP185/190
LFFGLEDHLLTTIQSFFFRFPWNNFLHNVVYDVVQQVFNGPMERGYNRSVAINLFESGSITEQIVEGQRRSDEAQLRKNMRLGYMGHLTLVAEEVVKFSERHPAELLSQAVMDKVLEKPWIDYVEQTLSETRERDNAILGGVRPDMSVGPRQAVLNAVNASQGFGNSAALANAGLNGGIAQQGLDSIELSNNGSASSGVFAPGSGSLLSGFGSSSDDEDEEMDEAEDDESRAATALATADSGVTENVGNAFELEDVVMSDE